MSVHSYPVIRRQRARLDADEAAFWYAVEADVATAERFVAALETAMRHLATNPESRSLRYAGWGGAVELRFWPVRGFPWLVFYGFREEQVDVWRVLHASRDIPQWLISED